MRKILNIALLVAILAGCGPRKPVSQVHNFKNATWERFKYLNFELPVESTRQYYDLSLILRHNDKFTETSLPVNVVMTTPEGEERIKEYTFYIKNNEGNFLGTYADGIYQLVIPLRKDIRFGKKGLVKFEIENLNSKYYTPGIIEMGVVMERAMEKKKE